MQTQIQTTDTNETNNATANQNPTAVRLARIPHIIRLPAETPPPPELMRLIEARIAEIKSEQSRLDLRDEDQAFEFGANKSILSILQLHLAELRRDFPETPSPSKTAAITPIPSPALPSTAAPTPTQAAASLTKKNSAEITETTETNLQPEQHPAETEVRQTETVSLPTEMTDTAANPSDTPAAATAEDFASTEQFTAELQKIPNRYHEIAADLYEHLHQRAKFAKLTSEQREAIYELSQRHADDYIVNILAQPAPIGMNFKTSRAGLYRRLQTHPLRQTKTRSPPTQRTRAARPRTNISKREHLRRNLSSNRRTPNPPAPFPRCRQSHL